MEDGQMFCDECGSRAGGRGGGQGPQCVINIRDKSAGIAAVLSFFMIGLGQIYVGKIGRGLLLMMAYIVFVCIGVVVTALAVLSTDGIDDLAGVGVLVIIISVCYLVLWVWNIFDAHKLANRYNDHLMANGNRPW
ncbi:MAG: hypothetical protein FWG41_01705 [Methanomassiliicoccaceae archaeon]|nr:hypothetical protein [Methanomassiliicoccaceae archaeon]